SGPCLSPSVAGRPLKPATNRCLGRPLPHQLANPISAAPIARDLAIPPFLPQGLCGISHSFDRLSSATGRVPIHYSPVCHSLTSLLALTRSRWTCLYMACRE